MLWVPLSGIAPRGTCTPQGPQEEELGSTWSLSELPLQCPLWWNLSFPPCEVRLSFVTAVGWWWGGGRGHEEGQHLGLLLSKAQGSIKNISSHEDASLAHLHACKVLTHHLHNGEGPTPDSRLSPSSWKSQVKGFILPPNNLGFICTPGSLSHLRLLTDEHHWRRNIKKPPCPFQRQGLRGQGPHLLVLGTDRKSGGWVRNP